MKTSTEILAGSTWLKISGCFDINTQHLFRSAYRKLIAGDAPKELVVDLSDIGYIDSSALGMLLLLRQEAEPPGIHISLAGCQPAVEDVLRTAQFHRLFTLRKL